MSKAIISKPLSNKAILLLFVALGFLLYGNTLIHEYALDDTLAITSNQFTKEGFAGISKHLTNDHFTGFYGQDKNLVSGGRYRPLSLVVFSIQYQLFGKKPWIGHLSNILFYIVNGLLLFLVLTHLLRNIDLTQIISIPLLASLLWFLHPIHTEAVANIKGLDEILSFSFALLALYYSLKFYDFGKFTHLLFIFIAFLLSLLSKESAITWLAIVPLAFYFFRRLDKKALPVMISLLAAAAVWFALRHNAIGNKSIFENVADNLMNDPFLYATVSDKFATIMYTMGKYIQLLFFPHPLTFDYYPKHIPIVGWTNLYVLFSSALLIVLAAISVIGFKRKSLVSFSILFYVITLSVASNILFPVGVFMNERFVYVSSLGFCLILAFYAQQLLVKHSNHKQSTIKIVRAAIMVVFVLYAIKTFSRNFAWENNYTLSTTDAKTSVNGAKSNLMAGGTSIDKAIEEKNPVKKQQLLNDAIFYLNRALIINPGYVDALLLMGNAQWTLTQNVANAMPYYQQILQMNSSHVDTWKNIHIVLASEKNIDKTIETYESLAAAFPSHVETYIELGRLYGQTKNDLNKAIAVLERGRSISPNNFTILSNLGTAYGMANNFHKAIEVLEEATQLMPNDSKTHADLGLSYYFAGELELAKAQFDIAAQLNPELNRSNFPI